MIATGARSPAGDSPPTELVARFKAALDRLWPQGGKLGLAVSGGPDSMAMLLLAEAAIPGQFEVATVDHGLRPEAADECAMVARVCGELGIACTVLRTKVGRGNLQKQARIARYAVLEDWAVERGLRAIATAHHSDDQAETLLMRLNRGSGLAGLAGVRERTPSLRHRILVVRPLLSTRRSELEQVVLDSGIDVVRDPSNSDDRFDRVGIRKALAAADWLNVEALAASARHLADAEEALAHYEQLIREQHGFADRNLAGISKPSFLTHEGQLRLVRWALGELNSCADGGDISRLVDRLREGKSGNLAGVLATVEGNEWVFRPEPPRRTG
jgi:tRNA(Ile)-lysidine synthase